jgi:lambda repressor-like predicted transcriptional regulator
MTEKMNTPVLTVDLIDELENLKYKLGNRLKNREDGSPVWNELVFAYSIEFYTFFYRYYSEFPDFSAHAVAAARHNAVISALEVIRQRVYNFNSLREVFEKDILDRVNEHIRREAKSKLIVTPPPSAMLLPPISAPHMVMPNDLSARRRAFVQPLLDEKGWSVAVWAEKAKVSRHTANSYLEGNRKTYHSNLVELAKALGIPFQSLPK